MLKVGMFSGNEGVSLQGDPDGGRLLSMLLRRCQHVLIPLDTDGEPFPSVRWLSSIELQPTEYGRVHISLSSDRQSLVVAFSARHADLMADNIAGVLIDTEPGYHSHLEYHPEHFYLHEGSLPTVVERV